MASGNLGTGLEGGLGGAALGFAVGGPIGAGIGLLAGGAMGGLFGGSKTYGFSKDDLESFYEMRMNQIKQFNGEYTSAINDYQNKATNIAQTTFSKFMAPGIMASLAATGFDPNSGAMNTAMANTSEQMQAGLFNNVFNATQNRLNAVNQSRAGAYNSLMGVGGQNFGTPQQPAWLQGLMGIAGSVAGRGGGGGGAPSGGGGYNGVATGSGGGASVASGGIGNGGTNLGWGSSSGTGNGLGLSYNNSGRY